MRKGWIGHSRMPLSGRPGDHQSAGGACRKTSKTMSVNPECDDTYGIINRWMAPFSPHFPTQFSFDVSAPFFHLALSQNVPRWDAV
jgi:hypothetical protein